MSWKLETFVLRLGLSAVLAVPALAGAESADGLAATLSLEASGVDVQSAADDVALRFTLANTSAQTVRIAKWHTPLTGDLYGPIFSVKRDGRAVEYVGKVYKLLATPLTGDYIALRPGASVSRVIELSEFYDMTAGGTYEVQYQVELGFGAAPNSARATATMTARLASNAVTFERAGDAAPAATSAGPEASTDADFTIQAVAPGFRSCSSSRQTALRSALPAAENYAKSSRSFLQNLPTSQRASNARYKTWFGAYTASRYSAVQRNFNQLASALSTKKVNFHCDCTESAYAYVFANDPYNIHLCNAFWSAPNVGRDSKAGTIVHELSHFNVVAGTDDNAYGHTACKSLARSNPGAATRNADSHEYFAENTN
jgi:peptidyl-Lys metalloendopeptidase